MLQLTTERPRPTKRLDQEELENYFEKICNKRNWKEEINALIPKDEYNNYAQAVAHFTGSELEILQKDDQQYLVYASGYYLTIGS